MDGKHQLQSADDKAKKEYGPAIDKEYGWLVALLRTDKGTGNGHRDDKRRKDQRHAARPCGHRVRHGDNVKGRQDKECFIELRRMRF